MIAPLEEHALLTWFGSSSWSGGESQGARPGIVLRQVREILQPKLDRSWSRRYINRV